MDKVKESTVSIAEQVLEKMGVASVKPRSVVGSDAKIAFKSGFCKGRRNCVQQSSFSITDDSGFIPLEKELERFTNSGQAYEQFMRMAFPNGSVDKVAQDYEQSFAQMSRLDAMRYITERSVELQNVVLNRPADKIKNKAMTIDKSVDTNSSDTLADGGVTPPKA